MTARKPKRIELEWYARRPRAALEGMRTLTPEERGIYNTILDLIYVWGNELVDDDRRNSAECNCDIRVYRRIKARLIDLEKLYTEAVDNVVHLRNLAADEEVAKAIARVIANRTAGAISSFSKEAKSSRYASRNNGRGPTPVATHAPTGVGHSYKEQEQVLPDGPILPAATGSGVAPEGHAGPVPTPNSWPAGAKALAQDALGPDFGILFGPTKVMVDSTRVPAVLTFPTQFHAEKAAKQAAAVLNAAFEAHGGWTTAFRVPSPAKP